jgi:hypothetical protein
MRSVSLTLLYLQSVLMASSLQAAQLPASSVMLAMHLEQQHTGPKHAVSTYVSVLSTADSAAAPEALVFTIVLRLLDNNVTTRSFMNTLGVQLVSAVKGCY